MQSPAHEVICNVISHGHPDKTAQELPLFGVERRLFEALTPCKSRTDARETLSDVPKATGKLDVYYDVFKKQQQQQQH